MSKLVSPEALHDFLMSLPAEVLQEKSKKVKDGLRNLRKKEMLSNYFSLNCDLIDVVKQPNQSPMIEKINFDKGQNESITKSIIVNKNFESADKVNSRTADYNKEYFSDVAETVEAA